MTNSSAIVIGICPKCGQTNQISGVTEADARADASGLSDRRIDVDCDHCRAQHRLYEFVEARRRVERERKQQADKELSARIAAQRKRDAEVEVARSQARAAHLAEQQRIEAEQRAAQISELRRTGRPPREFRVEVVSEGWLSVIFFVNASIPVKKMVEVMNHYGSEGWDLAFQLIERRRFLLFWSREAAVLTFSRELQ